MFHDVIDYLGTSLFGSDAYRRFQFKRARKIARRVGYEVYKPHLIWLTDPEFLAARDEVTRLEISGIPYDRCYMLLETARNVRAVPGEIAECGMRYGKSSLFLLCGAGADSSKFLHGFDSFAGLSTPGADDLGEDGDTVWQHGELAVAEEIARRNLARFSDRVVLYKVWIPERFSEVEDRQFSLVHIDVDLYDPTRDAVAFFYSKVNPGGAIICDDYGSAYCPGAKKAIDEFFSDKPEQVISLPTGQSLVIKL
jgi:hypothetical protein